MQPSLHPSRPTAHEELGVIRPRPTAHEELGVVVNRPTAHEGLGSHSYISSGRPTARVWAMAQTNLSIAMAHRCLLWMLYSMTFTPFGELARRA